MAHDSEIEAEVGGQLQGGGRGSMAAGDTRQGGRSKDLAARLHPAPCTLHPAPFNLPPMQCAAASAALGCL